MTKCRLFPKHTVEYLLYYKNKVLDYSTRIKFFLISRPLTPLLRKLDRKEVPWTWDASHQQTISSNTEIVITTLTVYLHGEVSSGRREPSRLFIAFITIEPLGQSIAEEYVNFFAEQVVPKIFSLSEVRELSDEHR